MSTPPSCSPWDLSWDIYGGSEQDLTRMVNTFVGGRRVPRSLPRLRQVLLEHQARWLPTRSIPQLLRLVRERYPNDPTYRGMERVDLGQLLRETQGARHLARYSLDDLVSWSLRIQPTAPTSSRRSVLIDRIARHWSNTALPS